MLDSRPNRLVDIARRYLDPPQFAGKLILLREPIDPMAESRASWSMQWVPGLPGTDQERLGRCGNFGTAEYNGACPQSGGVNI